MKKKVRISKRLLSLLLTVIMTVSVIPLGMVQASAASNQAWLTMSEYKSSDYTLVSNKNEIRLYGDAKEGTYSCTKTPNLTFTDAQKSDEEYNSPWVFPKSGGYKIKKNDNKEGYIYFYANKNFTPISYNGVTYVIKAKLHHEGNNYNKIDSFSIKIDNALNQLECFYPDRIKTRTYYKGDNEISNPSLLDYLKDIAAWAGAVFGIMDVQAEELPSSGNSGTVSSVAPKVNASSSSNSYRSSSYYKNLCNVSLTGNQREDIVRIAESQIGYRSSAYGSGNYSGCVSYGVEDGCNEYSRYLGKTSGGAWCADFVSWCARMANIPTYIIKSTGWASPNEFGIRYEWSKAKGGSYTPKRGDFIFFNWNGYSGWSHVGIVSSVSGNNVTYVDGNGGTGDVHVRTKTNTLTWSEIKAYGIPNYQNNQLTVPATPSTVTCSKKTIAAGDVATFTWSAVSGATSYYVDIWTKGLRFKDATVSGTSYSFTTSDTASDGQIYSCFVYAKNSAGTSGKISDTFSTKNPSTVTFANFDGTDYETQTVKYGYKAVAPSDPPEREGYTFNGWEGIDSPVYADKTLTATYTRNKYNVNFYKYVKKADGTRGTVKLGDTQKVYYGENATAPDPSTFDLPTGHVFASWSDSFENIKENKNIYLVDKWYNDNMSILVSDLVAVRDDDGNGYTVTLKVTNNDTSITSGRVIVALKTSEEKLVETTESSAFSLKAGANKTLEIFIPSTKAASIVDAYAVEKFETAIPISVTQRANIVIDEDNLWTDWSTEAPPADAVNTQTQTQYRYKEKDYKTSGYDVLDGYTWYDQKTSTSTSSDYVQTVPSNTTTNEGKKTYTYQTYYKYGLYGWTYDGGSDWTYAFNKWEYQVLNGARSYYPKKTDAQLRSSLRYFWNYETTYSGEEYTASKNAHYANYNASTGYSKESGTYYVRNSKFFNYGKFYKVTTTTTLNYFYKWLDWTDWSDTSVSATDNRAVETRTVYRYIPKSAMAVEDNSGEQRHISGTLSADYAGQQATLFVYKYDEASDWTNEYVGQCVIGQDGSYNFDFILRDEPTVKTGDYTVTLGLEGTDTVIYLDPILAPVEQFTVNYYNPDGTIASTQTVNKGASATVPDFIPEKEGYTFTGWSESNTNIKENLDIFPEFRINTYDVVFINWETRSYETRTFNYGDTIESPEAADTEDKAFVGWDIFTDNNYVVSANAVACAVYETKQLNVKFYDWEGNEIKSETVEYGGQIEAPDLDEMGVYIFDGWSTYDFCYVTDDLEVRPTFHFATTVETPTASVDTGVYSENQQVTLTCPTEGAIIYYTLDGSDPAENGVAYTGPISVAKSTVLKFVAKKTECNNSDVVTKCYAINKANMDSDWMAFDELPEEVVNNPGDYTMLSAVGYKYKDTLSTQSLDGKETLLNHGWQVESVDWTEWSDYSETYPVNADGDIEIDSKDADPVEQAAYNYSHYKYVDPDSGDTVIKPDVVEGTNGQTETLKLYSALNVNSFVGTEPAFLYNGELWFKQTITQEFVDPGYDVYRYRTKIFNLYRWTSWTTDTPAANEEREYTSGTVFKYTVPNEYVVTVDYSASGIADKENETVLVKEGALAPYTADHFETQGYTFDGLFTDSGFENAWTIEADAVTGNITLYPKYTMKTFTVRFLDHDASVISEQTVQYLNFAQIPEDPARDGYVFTGWEVTAGAEPSADGVTSDIDYTAKYVAEADYVRVSLSRSKLSLMTGSSAKLTVTVSSQSGADSEIYMYSSNPDVATVDEFGNVTAIHSGTAVITALSLDTYESANCVVTVLGTPDTEILPVNGSGVTVDASTKYLLGVTTANNTLGEIGDMLQNADLVYTNEDGSVVYDPNDASVRLGTGFKIVLKDGDYIVDTVELVVYGDINGDGFCDALDARVVKNRIRQIGTATMTEIAAATGFVSDNMDVSTYQSIVNMALDG